VDVHNPEAFGAVGMRCINVEPFVEYGNYLMNLGRPLMVLSPDKGSLWRARILGQALNSPFDYFEKFRDRITGDVSMRGKVIGDVGRVVIIDDIVATGGTIIEAIGILRSLGIGEIHVLATHCLLLNDADKRIMEAGASSITCSNTVRTRYSHIDVVKLMLRAIGDLL
jgi:ribose-phosphate pyrophosphokinase